MMFNEPRNWKWAVPMMLVPVFGLATYYLTAVTMAWALYLACVPGTATLVMMILTVNNFVRYQAEWKADLFDHRQQALNLTPVTMLADSLREMHPEAVKVLNRFGAKTRWGVKVDVENGDRDWMLLDTNVHLGFVEFVMNNSTRISLYPKNRFSEGSRKWDPDGLVEDREQYKELEGWLNARLMVTRPFGENHPAQFIPPWTPETIKEAMGFAGGEMELWKAEEAAGSGDPHRTLDDLIPLKIGKENSNER